MNKHEAEKKLDELFKKLHDLLEELHTVNREVVPEKRAHLICLGSMHRHVSDLVEDHAQCLHLCSLSGHIDEIVATVIVSGREKEVIGDIIIQSGLTLLI